MRNQLTTRFRGIIVFVIASALSFSCLMGMPQEKGKVDKAAEIDKLLNKCLEYGHLNGTVLVAEKGKIIYKKAFGLANASWDVPNTLDSVFYIYSMSKQFTALLTLQLVAEGKLKLDGVITDYLPYYRKETGNKITIHHLLTHTHGVPSPGYEDMPTRKTFTTEAYVKRFLCGDLEFEPGSRFKYGIGFDLLVAIMEKVTGKDFETLLKERILDPLGMKNTGIRKEKMVLKHFAQPYRGTLKIKRGGFSYYPCNGGSALYSTLDDLYKWDRALYTDKLLPKKYRDLMMHDHFAARTGYYAYGWDITHRKVGGVDKKYVWHGGGGSTMIFRSIQDEHLVIILNNKTDTQHLAISHEIMKILYDLPYKVPKKSLNMPFLDVYDEKGIDAAIKIYWELKKKFPEKYPFDVDQLNGLGYLLLGEKRSTMRSRFLN